MNKLIRLSWISILFAIMYITNLFASIDNIGIIRIYYIFLFIIIVLLIYLIHKSIPRNMLIIFLTKFVIFLFLLSIIFFIEQLFLQLFLYGLDAPGYLQNNGMIENIKRYSDLTWNEKLYWQFIFTLYYPIYIIIFFKPFVNHLDKSIKRIQEKENMKLN